jgi:sRNA-binding regulator protein Hfq
MREDIRHDVPAAGKPAPRLSFEDAFYRRLVATGVPVHIRCRDGYEIPTAIVRDFGTYAVMVEVNGVQEMVFKHGIISIRPYGPLPPESLSPS